MTILAHFAILPDDFFCETVLMRDGVMCVYECNKLSTLTVSVCVPCAERAHPATRLLQQPSHCNQRIHPNQTTVVLNQLTDRTNVSLAFFIIETHNKLHCDP